MGQQFVFCYRGFFNGNHTISKFLTSLKANAASSSEDFSKEDEHTNNITITNKSGHNSNYIANSSLAMLFRLYIQHKLQRLIT